MLVKRRDCSCSWIISWSGTYEEYLDIRSSQVTGRHIRAPYNDYSPSTILKYYNESIPGICTRNPDYVLGYSIGYLTVEAMNAMAGADSAMHMYSLWPQVKILKRLSSLLMRFLGIMPNLFLQNT
jgi:hypothetical protein